MAKHISLKDGSLTSSASERLSESRYLVISSSPHTERRTWFDNKGTKEIGFVLERMKELNSFLDYLVSRPDLFSLTSVLRFFDPAIPETKIGELLETVGKDYRRILKRLEKSYPQYKEVS